ncbi:MAG: hypothetical protein IJV39_03625 [Ruminococcus sp.]|nr:hypothetical protein [Ruminococcus sp.]
MQLGYYCPSPVFDLIVGNVHRGKILKRMTKRSRPVMKYGFNSDNQIVTFIDFPPEGYVDYDVCGFALYDENTVTYFCFRKAENNTEIEWISQAEYDKMSRIVRYTTGEFISDICQSISQEAYAYTEEGIKKVVMWSCAPASEGFARIVEGWGKMFEAEAEKIRKTNFTITQDTYLLHRDGDGYLSGYEYVNSDYWKGHIFEISSSKRRKI